MLRLGLLLATLTFLFAAPMPAEAGGYRDQDRHHAQNQYRHHDYRYRDHRDGYRGRHGYRNPRYYSAPRYRNYYDRYANRLSRHHDRHGYRYERRRHHDRGHGHYHRYRPITVVYYNVDRYLHCPDHGGYFPRGDIYYY